MQLGFWTLQRLSVTLIVYRSKEKAIWIPQVILILYNEGRTILQQGIRCCIFYIIISESFMWKLQFLSYSSLLCIFFFFCLCYFYITAVAEPCTKHKTALRLVLNAQLLLSESNKADPWKEGNCQHWRTWNIKSKLSSKK